MAQLRPGDTLEDRYRIVRVLRGEGGESEVTVYLAEDVGEGGGEVSITEVVDLLPSHAWRLAAESAFQANVPTLRMAQHPALLAVFDAFNVGRRHYLVTEYVPGEPLQAVLDSAPGQPAAAPDQVRDWAIALCSALQHLHSQAPPVILRDLSPAGMLLTADGTLKLAEFGFTRMFLSSNVQTLAAPGYAPPEQYARLPQSPDARSDIYALGATLHYLLTGRDPGLTPFVFPDAAQLNPAVAPQLARIIARAVALEPGGRYPSAEAMLAELRAFKNQPRPAPAPPPAPPPPPPVPTPEPKPPVVKPTRIVGVSPPKRQQRRTGPDPTALLIAITALLLLLLVGWAVLSGRLPFGGGGVASPTVPLATATRIEGTPIPTVPLVAGLPTATSPIVAIDSPVPLITFTPTASAPPPVTDTPAGPPPATGTPLPPTATSVPGPPGSPTTTPVPSRFGVVQENAVNVRAVPGATGRVLGQAGRGDILEVVELRSVEGNPWYRLIWEGQEGWIVGTYLRLYDNRPAAADAAAPLLASRPTATATPGP